MQTISELWRSLLPLVQQEIAKVSSRAAGTSGGLATHALDGAYHSGSLGDSQAPQFAKLDGSRSFTGNLTFVGAQTVDGVDISAHAANASAHHAPVTAGTLIGLSGQQVSVANGSAQYQVPVTGASPFTPAFTALSGMAGDGLTFGSGAFAVGAGTLISVGANDISLANGSAQYQVPVTGASPFTPAFTALSGMAGDGLTFGSGAFAVGVANTGATGLTVEANAVRLTSSNNTGAAAAILATDATGTVTVPHVVGGTDVATPALKSSAALAITSSSGDISLDASTNAIKIGASNTVKADNYASQTTGWAIDYDGGADFRYLFTDELHAKSFIADLEQALAGGQIVSKSVAILAVDFTAPAAGATATLRVKDLPSAANMAVFQSGDIVRLRKFSRSGGALSISDCWGAVTSYADQSDGTQTWTFTRSTAPNAGAMTASTVVDADSIVLDYGTSGNGFYEVNAIDGTYAANSPYWQIVSWTGHPATGQTVNVRGGKLTGITSTANEYGIFAGTGTTASDSYLIASTEGATQNNISSAWTSGGTSLVTIDPTHGLNLQSYDSSGGVISYGDQRIIGWAASLPSSSPDGVIWTQYSTTQNEMHVEARQTGSRAGLIQLAAYGEAASGNYADTVLLTMAGAESSATRSYLNIRADDVEIDLGNGSANIGNLTLYSKQLLYSDGSSSDDGSATNPAYSFLNDTNTGFFRPAADTLALTLGGNRRFDFYSDGSSFFASKLELGQAVVADHLGQALFRYSTQAAISMAATAWGYASHIGFNAYLADRSVSYTASGAWKYVGAQYTGNVTSPGLLSFDGNSHRFSFRVGEQGLATGSDITSWGEVLRIDDDGTLTLFGDLAWSSGGFTAAWTALTYNTGWGSYGSPYKAMSYCRIGDMVLVNGLVLRSSGTSSTIGTLPSGYRPTTNKIFDARASIDSVITSIRVDVDSSGNIVAINLAGGSTVGFISLDNIQFRTNS